jgi:sigma-B regulation protein RsbU (phosphoserine phosphatase)
MMIEEMKVDQYFTMAYADINLASGNVDFVQAGHPHPVVIRADGRLEQVGNGGLPIGLIPEAVYERCSVLLRPGDRLFLSSDGITECTDPQGNELGGNGLMGLLAKSVSLPSAALLEALIWDLTAHAGGRDFPDDVSGVLFDFTGRP